MAARRGRKMKRRRSPKTVSLWNVGVGWIYLDSFTRMATGYGPVGFLMGAGDLGVTTTADAAGYFSGGR